MRIELTKHDEEAADKRATGSNEMKETQKGRSLERVRERERERKEEVRGSE